MAGPVVDPHSGEVIVATGEMIEEEHAAAIEMRGIDKVHVRSPLTCILRPGICANCYGRDLARGGTVKIGEAVGTLPAELLATEPDVPWREVVAMRHKLAHHYYDAAIGILATTINEDLPELAAAIDRLTRRVTAADR